MNSYSASVLVYNCYQSGPIWIDVIIKNITYCVGITFTLKLQVGVRFNSSGVEIQFVQHADVVDVS